MRYAPTGNDTARFPPGYEIYIGLAQCCEATGCWYYGGPGLRNCCYIYHLVQSVTIAVMLVVIGYSRNIITLYNKFYK